ncbi:MAG: CYTH domain-containing protein [Deltaproteobacteria bacterium]|nr:CYTH domain-containing protein [Deltaproteobacteria bacterium]
MGKEIERKFLVTNDAWRAGAKGKRYVQGYLSTNKERTVRVRIAGEQAFLTIKGLTVGTARAEFEYAIPVPDAAEMLKSLCEQPIIEKTRYKVEHGGLTWEIDEFDGVNKGLIVAEVELSSEGQSIDKPSWAGADVSDDRRYFNSNLISKPFTTW